MAGVRNCPCCHVTEEPRVVPMSTQSLATTLAPADKLWSARRDKAVNLRMEASGPGSETPVTIHQMFLETVERSGDQTALVFKEDGQTASLTWRQYYEQCRAAAKSFLKVCNWIQIGKYGNSVSAFICTSINHEVAKLLQKIFRFFACFD